MSRVNMAAIEEYRAKDKEYLKRVAELEAVRVGGGRGCCLLYTASSPTYSSPYSTH